MIILNQAHKKRGLTSGPCLITAKERVMHKEAEMTFFWKFGDVPIRKRICAKLKCRKRHEYLCAELPHRLLFDSKWLIEIPKNKQNSEDVYEAMIRLGAPERCHLVSENRDKDGAEMLLKNALEMVVCKGLFGNVIISIPDRLGYSDTMKGKIMRTDTSSTMEDLPHKLPGV